MFLRWRPRFSLGLLLYGLSLISIGLALYLSRTELHAKRREAEKLRVLCGYLTIKDPNKPQIISIKNTDDHTYTWRVYLPKNQTWELLLATDGIPLLGDVTGKIHRQILTPQEPVFLLQIQFERQADGPFVVVTKYPGSKTVTPVSPECAAWLDPKTSRRSSTSSSLAGGRPEPLLTDKSNELMRMRVTTGDGMATTNNNNACGGLFLSLKKQEEAATSK